MNLSITKGVTLGAAVAVIYSFFAMKWLGLAFIKVSAHQLIKVSYRTQHSEQIYLLYLIPFCALLIFFLEFQHPQSLLNKIAKVFCMALVLFFGYYVKSASFENITHFEMGYYVCVVASLLWFKDFF